ncbi:MAG TPA: hypothetical protein VK932_09010, partial [Kofleriaceae bacterium]|nr:hypothetical protein [Kofleriaceae bacterium]
MRAFHRSLLFLVGVALAASPAFAQPKKGDKTPAPTEGGGDEIEMGDEQPTDVNPDEIDMGAPEDQPPADLATDMAGADGSGVVKVGEIKRTPLSWKDILVVVRKPFLKARRTELYPFIGTTMNDNMVRHYTIGGELAYYLTDVLAVGVEGL